MSRIILGISGFYHDSAAAILRDGRIVAAAQEERFSRKKHDPRFPRNAVNYCLGEAYVETDEIDAIVFYDNPVLTWDRVVKSCIAGGQEAEEQFGQAAVSILGNKLWVEEIVRKELGGLGQAGRLLFVEHHMAHAASAFFPSPFEQAAVITVDGVGEWATTTIGRGDRNRVDLLRQISYPHSLGLLYSAFTYFCGFKVNSGEYKLMGLAPYGRPRFVEKIREELIDVREDGSYRLNMEYFGYLNGLAMTNERFNSLFGGPPREAESRITRREMDLAASIQKVTEDVMLKMARDARRQIDSPNLVLAGGVALNCVANGKILAEKIFDHVWIQPAAGDAGGALGAALAAHHAYFGEPRTVPPGGRDSQKGSYLGPAFSSEEIIAFLDRYDYPYERMTDRGERHRILARALADGKTVGFFSGRMEFGPRALGGRSILGDPRRDDTQSIMNLKIKYRESFRPFAPSVLSEIAAEHFELEGESPYMLLVAGIRPEHRLEARAEHAAAEDMISWVNQRRSHLPAITHVDYSARIQTVNKEDHPVYHDLLSECENQTGCGVLVNTSFNVRGEPIVGSPRDAYRCFMRTEMDVLVLEDCVLWKDKQPPPEADGNWRDEYELD